MVKPNRNRNTLVGLEIAPGRIAAAEVSVNGRVMVERAAVAPLGPDVIRDGDVADVEALSSALSDLFGSSSLPKRVRLGVASHKTVLRIVDLPPLDDPRELEAAVRFQAAELVPMPLEQAVLDFHPVGQVESEQGPRQRVVLVAARRDLIDGLLAATKGAGLKAQGIDLAAFAMIRALPTDDEDDAVVYLHVGGLTNIAVAHRGICTFTRVAPGGVDAMAADLAQRRELNQSDAARWLAYVGLARSVAELEGDPELVAESREILEEGVRRLARELQGTLEFYASQGGGSVGRTVLTGPVLAIDGIAQQLSDAAGLQVDGAAAEVSAGAGLDGVHPGEVTVAAGLAVEERPA